MNIECKYEMHELYPSGLISTVHDTKFELLPCVVTSIKEWTLYPQTQIEKYIIENQLQAQMVCRNSENANYIYTRDKEYLKWNEIEVSTNVCWLQRAFTKNHMLV